jgi:hypothetical protein
MRSTTHNLTAANILLLYEGNYLVATVVAIAQSSDLEQGAKFAPHQPALQINNQNIPETHLNRTR